jgi:hypothetical protein
MFKISVFRQPEKVFWGYAPARKPRPNLRIPEVETLRGTDLYHGSSVRAVLREIRSWYCRIRELLGTQIHLRGVRLDPRCLSGATLAECRQAETAYTRDMRNLCADYRWVTMLDFQTFSLGWLLGAAWGRHNSCNEHLSKTLTLPVLSAQETSLDDGQTSCVMPAAIAGVTRSEE